MGLDQSIAGAMLAGLLSFLSPCVLPLTPAYLAFLAGAELKQLEHASDAAGDRALARRSIARATMFALGFATVFIALGATATSLGAFVARWFDWLAVVAGVLLVTMGLHFIGVFRIALLFREARFQTEGRPASLWGAYVVGLAFAFGWTPCVGPVLAAILIVAGGQDSVWRGVMLLGAYALGMGLPFILAAVFVGPFMRFMARFRAHIGWVEKIMGAGLIVTGLLFMTGAMPRVGEWMLRTVPIFEKIG